MTIRQKRILIWSVIGAALLGVSVWLGSHLERVPVERDTGFRGEARHNPLLAAEHLLTRLGLAAESERRLSVLPPTDATLVWPVQRRNLGPNRSRELLEWAQRGGHLVITAGREGTDTVEDPLLRPLGVIARPTAVDDEYRPVPVSQDIAPAGADVEFDPAWALRIRAKSQPVVLAAQAPSQPDAAPWIYSAHFRWGRGSITILSDARFMENAHIGEHDNAYFFWRLVDGSSEVRLVFGDDLPTLWRLTAQHAWMALMSAAVWLVMWLWSSSRRFGPMLPAEPTPRRRLVEHIEASGRFLWKHGLGSHLVQGARESLLRTLEFRHPGWSTAPDLAERLAGSSGLPAETIGDALRRKTSQSPEQFTHDIRLLETIRRAL